MPNTTAFEFGDVVLVPFPFTDQTTTKQRPAVVVTSQAYDRERPDVLLLAITSQQRPTSSVFEVGVEHWQHAGLLKPSTFKPLVATVERPSIRKKLGRLHADDQGRLRDLLDRMLGT